MQPGSFKVKRQKSNDFRLRPKREDETLVVHSDSVEVKNNTVNETTENKNDIDLFEDKNVYDDISSKNKMDAYELGSGNGNVERKKGLKEEGEKDLKEVLAVKKILNPSREAMEDNKHDSDKTMDEAFYELKSIDSSLSSALEEI
jgi:hypothetical protein